MTENLEIFLVLGELNKALDSKFTKKKNYATTKLGLRVSKPLASISRPALSSARTVTLWVGIGTRRDSDRETR